MAILFTTITNSICKKKKKKKAKSAATGQICNFFQVEVSINQLQSTADIPCFPTLKGLRASYQTT